VSLHCFLAWGFGGYSCFVLDLFMRGFGLLTLLGGVVGVFGVFVVHCLVVWCGVAGVAFWV